MSRFVNWDAADLQSNDDWKIRIGEATAREVIGLAKMNVQFADDLLSIDTEKFPLSSQALRPFLQAIDVTQRGYGLSLLKGFPCRQLSETEFRVAVWGVGLYLGVARPQNVAGDIVTDVRDSGSSQYRVVNGRGYNTRSELDFHIDSGDVVLLACRREARRGGASLVANPFAIIDHLLKQDGAYADLLKYSFPFSLGGYQVDGKDYYLSSLLDGEGDATAFRINIKNIRNGSVQSGIEIPADKLAFLYQFQELAGSERFCYRMHLEEGDIQILNNYRIIHSRTAFEDDGAFDEKRHLLRLWLSLKASQPLPASWLPSFHSIGPGTVRGGYRAASLGSRYQAYVQSRCRHLQIPLPAPGHGDSAGSNPIGSMQ